MKTRGSGAWALYDMANTVYSMMVVTLFFPQWVTVDRGREDLWFSVFFGGSMLAVALTLPYLGLRSDWGGGRLRFLAAFTAVSVTATASLGWLTTVPGQAGLLLALSAFAISNYAFQGALVFYNSLLPAVSTPETRGRVSGFGVALGYVGSLVGMLLVVPFAEGAVPILGWKLPLVEAGGRTAVFVPTAVIFGLLSVPVFLRVREPRGGGGDPPRAKDAWKLLLAMIADARRYPGLKWFLIGNFLILDAIHTAIVFIAVFAEKVVGLPDSSKAVFFILATIPAILGSFVAGWASDRVGPRRVFLVTAWLWVVCPLVIAAPIPIWLLYGMGGVIGILLGSLWTVTRPLLLMMIPGGEEGRGFGLYALCNKTAAVLGPQIWGLTVLLAAPLGPAKYRLAIVVLALVAAAGAVVLHRIPDPARRGGDLPVRTAGG